MLPVVRGEAETRRQILLYTVLLYAVTQLPFCAGGFGGVYLVASMVLGLGFIAGAVLLYRAGGPPQRAASCTCTPWRTWRCCSARWSPTCICRLRAAHDDPAPGTQEHPHRPDRVRDLHVHVRHHVRRRRGLRLVSPLDPEVPPAGEEIHLPGPSILPLLTARRDHAGAGRDHDDASS